MSHGERRLFEPGFHSAFIAGGARPLSRFSEKIQNPVCRPGAPERQAQD
jgi:hypothetical protein